MYYAILRNSGLTGSNQTVAGLKCQENNGIPAMVYDGSNQTVAGLKSEICKAIKRRIASSNQTVAGLKWSSSYISIGCDSMFKSDRCGIEITSSFFGGGFLFYVQIRPLRDWNSCRRERNTSVSFVFKSDRCGIEISPCRLLSLVFGKFKSDRCGIEIGYLQATPRLALWVQIRPLRDWNLVYRVPVFGGFTGSNQTVAGLKFVIDAVRLRLYQSSNQTVAGLKYHSWIDVRSWYDCSNQTVAGLKSQSSISKPAHLLCSNQTVAGLKYGC